MNQREAMMSAAQAAEALGISRATLYSYVSRGLLRSATVEDDPRQRRYHADDVRALQIRQMQRRQPARVVEESLHWGAPLLDTSISLVADGHLYYRGVDATRLARTQSLEQVACLLWEAQEDPFESASTPLPVPAITHDLPAHIAAAGQAALAQASLHDDRAFDLRPDAVRACGARILDLLTTAISGKRDEGPVARRLQKAWCRKRSAARPLLQAALVLCAEHELNVSAFAARCVASAGATPYAVVSAGLAALGGRLHGGVTERVERLVDAAMAKGGKAAVGARLRRGEDVPGFGHPLYPDGDPRAHCLLDLLTDADMPAPIVDLVEAGGGRPTIDLALVALSRALDLPAGAPFSMFALGRTAGWIAHALEQYGSDRLIRPRARYVGPLTAPA